MPRYTVAPQTSGSPFQRSASPEEHAIIFAWPSVSGALRFGLGTFLLARNLDDVRVLHLDESVGNHVEERRQYLVDLGARFDKLDTDRQVLGKDVDFRRVQLVVAAKAGNRPSGSGAGDTLVQ